MSCVRCLAAAPQNQHDVLCVLLMIRLNSEHRSLMARRRVPCLDDYLDRLNLALWPRFKVGFRSYGLWVLVYYMHVCCCAAWMTTLTG